MIPSEAISNPQVVGAAGMQGLLTMAGLIVAIGAQNALVLRQGLARRHVWPVVALCTVSDWLLTALGVFGLGAVIARSPVWLEVCRYAGAAFLLLYGVRSAWRAWTGPAEALAAAGSVQQLGPTLAATLAMTYLNPHVYLDTVVLMGTLGAQHVGEARVAFVGGAGLASALWFSVLGFGAAVASRWLHQPAVWRAIDAAISGVMLWMAVQLALRPFQL
ncbi:LysE/ArgO family amino acid transporter [Schlegelella sp. S2-27]|uniref:LysE/ArgO family amino acid transporter n=1 Tax=Caldimonas mangrovi TaxID=2944811 RepID=A0ABT0YSZ9_9BURK|nr:LysE/ArgO family amino acid transporter [Caldimonas mangrovi]MCM5681867.1 LysE/ArgO family amino acid transporter [Caldimonas mangrovi]